MTRDSYVLLWRHGRHDRGHLRLEPGTDGRPDRFPVESVAERLQEVLTIDPTIVLSHVFHAPTPEARATARVVQDVLAGREPDRTPVPSLAPAVPADSTVAPPEWARNSPTARTLRVGWTELDLLDPSDPAASGVVGLRRLAERIHAASAPARAVAVIGHDPQVEQLSAVLQRWSWWRRPRAWMRGGVPIQAGEVVCLRGRPASDGRPWNGHLAWQISPDDREAEEQIRDKVKSKMEAAKQLSAVITLLLTALLGAVLRTAEWDGLAKIDVPLLVGGRLSIQLAVQIAVVLLLLSLGLYLAAMYAYDSLLMPSRFWVAGEPDRSPPRWLPARPPGSAAWVLNRNMQRTWAWLFQPATVLVAAAFVVVAVPLLRLDQGGQLILLAVLLGYLVMVRWFQPVLGSTD